MTKDALAGGAAPTASAGLSYDEAARKYLDYVTEYRSLAQSTVQTYRGELRMFRGFLEKRPGRLPAPEEITREIVLQYGISLRGAARQTLRKKYTCLSCFFTFLRDMGYVHADPASQLPLPKPSRRVPVCLSEETAQKLLAAADRPWTKTLIMLLLSTGIRRSEAAGITLDDLDLERRQLLIRGKGDKERIVPLTEQAVAVIEAYLTERVKTKSRHLFVSGRGGEPIHPRVINYMFQSVLRKAQLSGQGITPHKLRHTFATHLIRNGVDIGTVRDLLGHADIHTTGLYLHSDTRTKEVAVGTLSGLLGA
jgi:site-specific recombinase XerD